MGYTLIPGNPLHKLFIFYGVPRSGKSVIGHIISKILGDDNVSSFPFESLNKEGHLAELSSKLLNLSGELQNGAKIETSTIKSLVGEDRVFGRKLYSDPFYFINPAKLLTIGNSLPYFNDDSSAIIERLVILNFETQVPENERNINLKSELEEELDGIFRWAIDGLISLQERGRFLKLQKETATKKTIQTISDSIQYWITELNISDLKNNEDDKKIYWSLKKAYLDYIEFCKESGISNEKKTIFKNYLSQLNGVKVYRDTSKNQDFVEIEYSKLYK